MKIRSGNFRTSLLYILPMMQRLLRRVMVKEEIAGNDAEEAVTSQCPDVQQH